MNKKFGKILAEISAGELIDKITILEIKLDKISDKVKIKKIILNNLLIQLMILIFSNLILTTNHELING